MANKFDHNSALNGYSEQLVAHYKELSSHASKVKSHFLHLLKRQITYEDQNPLGRSLISRFFRFADTVAMPMFMESSPSIPRRGLVVIVAMLTEIIALVFGLVTFTSLADFPASGTRSNNQFDFGGIVMLSFVIGVHILITLGIYRWVLYQSVNSHYSLKTYFGAMLFLLAFIVLAVFAPVLGFQIPGITYSPLTVSQLLERLTQSSLMIGVSIFAVSAFLTPSIGFFLNLSWHMLIWCLWILVSFMTYLDVFHNRATSDRVLPLAHEEIPAASNAWILV